jgi:hypothetical protein
VEGEVNGKMVYVFGMNDVPLFEMMFIIMALMLMGLIFLLLEIRKLTLLITQEKQEIKRFEGDLMQFEDEQGNKKPSAELLSYIKDARLRGIDEVAIQASLVKSGWDYRDAQNILESLHK